MIFLSYRLISFSLLEFITEFKVYNGIFNPHHSNYQFCFGSPGTIEHTKSNNLKPHNTQQRRQAWGESHSVKVAWLHHAQGNKGQQKHKVLTGQDQTD